MLHALAKNWGLIALRGAATLLFGILTFMMPGITLITLVYLFGFYALFEGIVEIAASFRSGSFWGMLLGGLLGTAAGIVTILWPGITAISLLYLIAAWAIVRGVFAIVTGIRLRKELDHEWYLILMGVASVAFGFLILAAPGAGALAIILWIAAFAVILGILLLALAFRLRGIGRRHMPGAPPLPV
jgi:uncharacterized membrane protein HdeD (DUF308 family)